MTASPIDVFHFLRQQLGTPSGFEWRGRLLDRRRGDILAALRDGVAPEVRASGAGTWRRSSSSALSTRQPDLPGRRPC